MRLADLAPPTVPANACCNLADALSDAELLALFCAPVSAAGRARIRDRVLRDADGLAGLFVHEAGRSPASAASARPSAPSCAP
jgi:hypothetical protein